MVKNLNNCSVFTSVKYLMRHYIHIKFKRALQIFYNSFVDRGFRSVLYHYIPQYFNLNDDMY